MSYQLSAKPKSPLPAGGKLIITFLFFIGALIYVHTGNLRTELRLILRVKVSQPDTFQLFINNKPPLQVNVKPTATGSFRTVSFPLPREEIKNLRINPGRVPGTIAIENITIKTLLAFSDYRLTGKRIQKLFYPGQRSGKHYTRDNIYYIETTDPDYWIAPGKSFYRVIGTLQSKKTFYYLLCVVLSLIFFYCLHFINCRGLKVFRTPRVLVNGVLVFILIIFFPLANQVLTTSGKSQLVEKRTLGRKPQFRFDSIFPFFKSYTGYYNDHFTFRDRLIYLHNLFKVKLLGVSPISKVLIGKDGWLFMDKEGIWGGTVEYYRSLTPFTVKELEQWKNLLEQRRQWLAARGIRYLFFIAPNKNTIYPEYMPEHIRKVHRRSRMDQLKAYLEKYSTVPFLDVREALKEAKKDYPVYSRTDTHWSEYGAYIVHREIMNYISRYFKEAEPIPLSRYRIKTVNWSGGDLAKMLSLHEEVLREDVVRMRPGSKPKVTGGKLENLSRFVRQGYMECKTAPLPNIIMVHDSFYNRLKPFLAESFSRIVFIWDWDLNFYPQVIDREKPNLVIDEMAERFLLDKIPVNPQL